MTWQTPQFSVVDAKSNQQDTYDVLVSSWGVPGGPPGDLQFPPVGQPGIPTSIAGMAIGPRSTVDRAFVTWNLQKVLPDAATIGAIKRLGIDSPIEFAMPAKKGTIGTSNDTVKAQSQGNIYIFPKTTADSFAFPDQQDSTIVPAGYVKSDPVGGSQVVEPFGTGATAGVFMPPFLHVVLYLRAPFLPPPVKRMPLVSRGMTAAAGGGANPEVCVAQIPVYGRKSVVVSVSADQQSDFRLGALRALATIGPSFPIEASEGSFTAVPQNTVKTFKLQDPCADYLMLYAKPAANATVQFVIAAYD